MKCRDYPASRSGEAMLVMLPAAGSEAEDFERQGLVAAVQAVRPDMELVVAQPSMDGYLDGTVAPLLHEAVIRPALARGRTRIALAGISLGGMGALLYAATYPANITALILLAPFLGTRGTIAAVESAGGFISFDPTLAATQPECRMLGWLGTHLTGGGNPALYLGYGESDRFAAGHRLLAQNLPPGRVATVPGGHDWPSWSALWQALLPDWTAS
jgi:pimeloyl-ACP methyl ester carboxylesterase